MRESVHILVLAVVTLLIAGVGVVVPGLVNVASDLTVSEYTAEISSDGILTETYVYDVSASGEYRMLYRYWEDSVVYDRSISLPHLSVIDTQAPVDTYVVEYTGSVYSEDSLSNSEKSFIALKAYENEIGMIDLSYFDAGEYTLSIVYEMQPPVEYDEQYYHVNLKLATEHIPYEEVTVILDDPNGDIVEAYTHPEMEKSQSDGKIMFTGSSGSNTLLEVEYLSKNISYGVQSYVDDVYEQTTKSNAEYSAFTMLLTGYSLVLMMLTFVIPLCFVILWWWKGREKSFTVPEFLSTIPKKRKPWLVNLVFHGSEVSFSEEGYFATILDLSRRGVLKLDFEGDAKRIIVNDADESLDRYERRLVQFFMRWGEDGVFDINRMEDRLKHRKLSQSQAMRFKTEFDGLRKSMMGDHSSEFVMSGRKFPAVIFAVSVLLVFVSVFLFSVWGSVYPMLIPGLVASVVLALQSGIATAQKPSLFGRWKAEYFKEKLEWDAFRKFCSDMAMLEKYEMEDIVMWQEWLVYATALGVGENVAKALRQREVAVRDAWVMPMMFVSFHHMNRTYSAAYARQGGSGGGFGAGGGFGGGGAGGR